ncbi:MAG TPA: hypothetical protein VMP01_01140, partial [Pirellulaceae bacterium]|nr:hypothetical protein [Pirellulaceae bacterium]
MAKTAIEFLSELTQRELVPPNIVASLRRQVGDSIKPVSAAAIARLLVEKGHLTAVQAEKLLGAPLAPARPPLPSAAETKPMESDLGLAPLQEIPAPTGTPAAAPKKPAEATTALEPLDLGLLDLLPLDEKPKPAVAAVPKPAAPVKKVPPAKPPAAAPLTPLSPLDTLEPLASPLTPIPLPAKHPPAERAAAPAAAQVRPPDPLDVAIPLAPPAKPAPAATPQKSSRAVGWIGGIAVGVVALAVVSGGLALLFFVSRQEQPHSFELAEQDYRAGQYAAAAEKYDAFLTADPRHEQAALARVRRGMARMLAAKGSGDNWPAVLPVASEVLAEIDGEEELPEVHAELAPLLTEMAAALAKRADDAAGADAAARLDEARRALALADNGRYIPG